MLTEEELSFTERPGDPKYIKWRTTKDVIRSRMNWENAELMIMYVGGLSNSKSKSNLLFAWVRFLHTDLMHEVSG